ALFIFQLVFIFLRENRSIFIQLCQQPLTPFTCCYLFILNFLTSSPQYFQMSPDIDFDRDHDTPIQGLTSILTHLGNLQVRLKVYPAHYLRQLQLDLEVMITYLESLAVSLRCSLPKPMTILHKHDTTFPITSSYLCLLELQSYMERFCLNLDKLHYLTEPFL
uniref:Leptin n=1 Tax=Electrophorus electricus TaxID=8005 RepID=A0A4W4F0L1_ELEEL